MPMHAEDLRRFLSEATGKPVDLKMNNNTHSLVSARPTPFGIRVSLHRMFLEGEAPLFQALARFIHRPTPEARAAIREFIALRHERITEARAAGPSRAIRGTARGRRFNLEERAAIINRRHFGGALQYRIIWGRPLRAGRRQHHVTLGTWNLRQRIIRIHPMLDMPGVPSYMVDFVIYHEMCHIAVPSQASDTGRMHHHTPEFRALERRYPLFTRAMAWEKRWISPMIAAWNGGPPLPTSADDGGNPETPSGGPPESGGQLTLF
ncbi:hypothetical protein GC173_15720 [bacterium]|nr:hypothetical protein [bacterium]